jgi:6-phosphogluconolactonase
VALEVQICPTADVPDACAQRIVDELRRAIDDRGQAVLALSGGGTPVPMFGLLAEADLSWDALHVVQVDERVAPDGHPDRNIVPIEAAFVTDGPLPAANLHPMDVTADDLDDAAARYCELLDRLARGEHGGPPVLDAVQLGIGPDGHTASLVPGDPVLDVTDRWVAVTAPYQGRQRLTLTYPVLDAARLLVWMVEGEDKAQQVARLEAGDDEIPAGRVERERAVVVCDPGAAADLEGQR